ncbi:MAG: ATPase [Phenylobacterium zucineum]|nr:MAG: ATPase [Phenylobacterium zucineum]
MTDRIDRGSRVIRATAGALYAAYLDPRALAAWRPPAGMSAEVELFEAYEGGRYRMSFIYPDAPDAPRGKSSETADTFEGRFVRLVPGRLIEEEVEFQSGDPAFAGLMTITTSFTPVDGGTEVAVACSNVPPGISAEDHASGIASSLENLARWAEA